MLAALRTRVDGEVDASPRRRAEYSSDASNYRVPPTAVVFPRADSDVAETLNFAREHGLPVTARGAGTSVAGNAIGAGLVLDFSRHMNRIVRIDPDSRTARVQPGVVLSALQNAARPHGLRLGPDPSTQNRCTLGGMIGNNACGPRAVAWGRTSDTVRELRILDGTGTERVLGNDLAAVPGLPEFTRSNLAVLRTELGRFDRQASGYGLEHLLPERGSALAKSFVGSEGTCGLLLDAEVELVELPRATVLTVLGYPDIATAADDVAAVMACAPIAVEGIDARLVDVVRTHRGTVPELPRGNGWLFVETTGANPAEALAVAETLCRTTHALDARIVTDIAVVAALWRIRADGAGLAGRTSDGSPAWPGWEDSAVPPEHLGAYLRDFAELTAQHGVDGLLYGHLGDGCIHVRLDLPITEAPQRFRAFVFDAAELVVRYGGSLSGEHGDGRARSELLSVMYSPGTLAAFAGFKSLFDPDDVLNPGVLVEPRPVDADLRVAGLPRVPGAGFAFPHDDGDIGTAVHRCVGVGKCRADSSAAGGFMCPSYLATADEKDSTRGRARVLQEVVRGELPWSAPAVAESLDLCLSCKACRSDCPAGVDMATYKAEAMYRRYRRRPRPLDHYALGWLPRWLRPASRIPRAANAIAGIDWLRRIGLRAAGIDPRREIPRLADRPFRRTDRARALLSPEPPTPKLDNPLNVAPADASSAVARGTEPTAVPAVAAIDDAAPRDPVSSGRGDASSSTTVERGDPSSRRSPADVLLWIDTFTDAFDPDIAHAAVTLIESLGHRVRIPRRRVCCGLTWISTGQLDGARAKLRATLAELDPHVRAGGIVVGLEPSCTATLRADLPELLADDSRAAPTAAAVRTLAEFLLDHPDWQPPRRPNSRVVVQPHCHQHSVVGFAADRRILAGTGALVTEIAGCCGLAGNFGMQKGHYDISVAVAGNGLLPALREAPDDALFLADGFSCRTQSAQLTGRPGLHLAQFLMGE
ncbi:FAD-binding and (Fe-S)-binding domain-containing protein [Nocardia amikacinitolerans]|uniref:FAD-binding and (Fe-S)-binding domain-containing protein n=1 Tax=Nocardia amikacinitolerans TaxID=756689 RepID=UPI0020A532D9|nr:FAD-binding and (Fe-S)-binding domain-containing protein [Nocardia amikacinitolerans]MCP2291439.1 FAD/FMN-containing dehydrogenase [Nocardia amikacinitolerans]